MGTGIVSKLRQAVLTGPIGSIVRPALRFARRRIESDAGKERRLNAMKAVALMRARGWGAQAREFERLLQLRRKGRPADADTMPNDRVLGVFHDMTISTLHFRPLDTEDEKRAAFKNGVRLVDIEIFSQCNRRCHYCSNAVLDRISSNTLMEPAVYSRIVADLGAIDWDGQLRFIGLNEPTMHRDVLVPRVREARAMVPKAQIVVFSSGDYLTRDYLEELAAAGVNAMYISVHLQRFAKFDDEKIVKRVDMLARRLGIPYTVATRIPGLSVVGTLDYPGMYLQFFQHDYEHVGHDRGGILAGIGRQEYVRTAACAVPIQMMVIAYNGNVMPCCHFVGDAAQHRHLFVGSLDGRVSLFDVYASPEYLAWRRGLFTVGAKSKECRNCVDYADSGLLQDEGVVGLALSDERPAAVAVSAEGTFRAR